MPRSPKKRSEGQVTDMFRQKINSLPPHEADREKLMQNVWGLLDFAFANGKGRSGTNSKTYTGPALEAFGLYCIEATQSFVGLDNAEINNDYIEDEDGEFDKIRLDLNVLLDGKLILMQESRVWLDKPFCTLKYQVIQDVVHLPHSRIKIDRDIIFPIITICCDVTDVTLATREHFFNMVLENSGLSQMTDYGEKRIDIFSLSAGTRSDGYFDAGMNFESVEKYIELLIAHFTHYKQRAK